MNTTEKVQDAEQGYNPNRLLDFIMAKYQLKNDAALARKLEATAPLISKIRHRRLPIGASLLIYMHELTGKPVKELRNIMGDRRHNFRLSTTPNHPLRESSIAAATRTMCARGETATVDSYHPANAS